MGVGRERQKFTYKNTSFSPYHCSRYILKVCLHVTFSARVRYYHRYCRQQRSCGKVIFSQTCVKNSVHRVGVHRGVSVHAGIPPPPPPNNQADTHPYWADPPPPADGYCNGRYASYWNAFLLNVFFLHLFCPLFTLSSSAQH